MRDFSPTVNLRGTAVCVALAASIGACQPLGPGADDTSSEATADLAAVFDGTAGSWIDLTYSFDATSIYWPTDTVGFVLEELAYGASDGGFFYSSYRYSGAEHGGTHLDAPIHFAEGRQTSDEIPLSSLIGPAAVVDVSGHAGADYLVIGRPIRDADNPQEAAVRIAAEIENVL